MEIIFKEQNGKLFGSTNMLGIGKKQPKLIYGEQAKKLREQEGMTTLALAAEFGVKETAIRKIEEQRAALEEKMFEKYKNKFGVEKEYFFDLDLERLILTAEGHVIKEYATSEECSKVFDELMQDYFAAIENKDKYFFVEL